MPGRMKIVAFGVTKEFAAVIERSGEAAVPGFVSEPIAASTQRFCAVTGGAVQSSARQISERMVGASSARRRDSRSEEHTSELQSRENIVCRHLLEKKKIY